MQLSGQRLREALARERARARSRLLRRLVRGRREWLVRRYGLDGELLAEHRLAFGERCAARHLVQRETLEMLMADGGRVEFRPRWAFRRP